MRHIPLQRALVCLDCEALYEMNGVSPCPACGSEASATIACWLEREQPKPVFDPADLELGGLPA